MSTKPALTPTPPGGAPAQAVALRNAEAQAPTQTPLAAIRAATGMSQQQMAAAIGLGVRAYQDQEADPEPRRPYLLAAQQIQARMAYDAIDETKPLPERDDEVEAVARAAKLIAQTNLFILTDIAGGRAPNFKGWADVFRTGSSLTDPAAALIDRRARYLAAEDLELAHMLS